MLSSSYTIKLAKVEQFIQVRRQIAVFGMKSPQPFSREVHRVLYTERRFGRSEMWRD